MHARSYSPTLGRFLQPDPIAAEGNLYGYAGNSPVTKSDPSGLWGGVIGPRDKYCSSKVTDILKYYRLTRSRYVAMRWGDPELYPGHPKAFDQVRNILADLIDAFDKHGCGGKGFKLPAAARSVAGRPAPLPNTSLDPRPLVFLGGAGAAAGGFVWWLGKGLAPLFGPLAPIWLVIG